MNLNAIDLTIKDEYYLRTFSCISAFTHWVTAQRKGRWFLPVGITGGDHLTGLVRVSRPALLLWIKHSEESSWIDTDNMTFSVHINKSWLGTRISIYFTIEETS